MDWNNNGHRDNFDRMMDYQLYKETTSTPTSTGSGGCLKYIVIAIIAFFILGSIGSACSKKKHTSSYRSSYSYSSRNYTTTPRTTYSNNSGSKSYNSYKYPTKHYNSSSKSYTDYDEYNAKDYSDAEDFYDDHYDDFDDYEDAEDYYDDYGE